MLGIKLDVREFERKAIELQALPGQIPFALSRALNDAARNAQTVLIASTWPRSVTVRNGTFLRAALRRIPSTKQNLTVAIVDKLGRANLQMHAVGGTKTPRGNSLAIPNEENTPRTAHGVRKADRPKALIARTPKRALRVTPRGIFVGKGGKLKLKYALKPATPQPKDVDFYGDFATAMRNEMRIMFPIHIRKAMETRRGR